MERRDFLYTLSGSLVAFSFLIFPNSGKRKIHSVNAEKEEGEPEIVVKVLGTAQDGGLPHFACFCRNCLRARKESQFSRLISSLALIDLKERIFFMLDATPDIRHQLDIALERLGVEKARSKYLPQAVILTHAHIGHYTGLIFFSYEAISSSDLPVYCSKRMKNFLVNNGPWNQLVRLKNISIQTISYDQKFSLTPQLSLTPFQVPHRDEYSDTLGFTISGRRKKLLYIPDIQSWKAWKKSIVEEVKNVDIALIDGTFYSPEELPGRDLSQIGHPFIKSSLELLRKAVREGAAKIYFTHLNHSNLALNPEGKEQKEIKNEGFELASEGMEFYL